MMQKDIMMATEGDAWLERNRAKLGQEDEVTHLIAAVIRKRPNRILEVGCANGWRLAKLRDMYSADVMGVEPSRQAAIEAAALKVTVHQTTASCLLVDNASFDLIIYGFCLYLTDPQDWLLIAAEGDRALAPGGHIIINDFGDFEPTRGEPYEHDQRLTSWHFDWAELWLAHPGYTMVHRRWSAGSGHAVTILRKERLFQISEIK